LTRTLWRRVRRFARRVQDLVAGVWVVCGIVGCDVEVQGLGFSGADGALWMRDQVTEKALEERF
jgi:hypothetical protein